MTDLRPLDPDISTIAAALREGQAKLAKTGKETPRLDAEVLLRHLLKLDRTSLFARFSDPIEPDNLATFRRFIEERARGVPVAYLTGEREFMGLTFAVGPGVLIPRPETEILVEWALRWLQGRERATVVDVGTGSGAIALSIAAGIGPAWSGRIIGVDISPDALAVAERNRAQLELEQRVDLKLGSLLSWLDEPADLILANLPYLRPSQIVENLELAAEPRLALDGGVDGLVLIRLLLADAPRVLALGSAIGLEIDPSQREAVVDIANRSFPGSEIDVLQDLAGLDRHLLILTSGPDGKD